MYQYNGSQWGDLLTSYNGRTFSYDAIGNLTNDGVWTYTWKHGRELATMSSGTATWSYTYNADGLRIKRTNGSTTYGYVYNGSLLTQMTVGSNTLYITYDTSGLPFTVTYNGTVYYYVLSLQGDVVGIVDSAGTLVVEYAYDAWGRIHRTTGSMAATLGAHNPLRYRSYVYDIETGLYYLQSRYYNPEIGRFINADGLVSTGQGLLGNNMFAYCGNNPVNRVDPTGCFYKQIIGIAETILAVVAYSSTRIIPLSDEQKRFIATIAGEAIGNRESEQKAVAHTIMNRYYEPRETWSGVKSVSDVLKPQWYNAVGGNQYNLCMNYLNNRDYSNELYEKLIFTVIPIYYGLQSDITGGAHFIFNTENGQSSALLEALRAQPDRYALCDPSYGIDRNKFCMYRCLW